MTTGHQDMGDGLTTRAVDGLLVLAIFAGKALLAILSIQHTLP